MFKVIIFFCLLFLGNEQMSYSYDIESRYDQVERILVRGVNNCITSPCEVWVQVRKDHKENGALHACWYGTMKGIAKGCGRFVWGVVDIVVSPINFLVDMEIDIMDPDTIIFDEV